MGGRITILVEGVVPCNYTSITVEELVCHSCVDWLASLLRGLVLGCKGFASHAQEIHVYGIPRKATRQGGPTPNRQGRRVVRLLVLLVAITAVIPPPPPVTVPVVFPSSHADVGLWAHIVRDVIGGPRGYVLRDKLQQHWQPSCHRQLH
uniref:Uncharacterized protein n=1 Tax=Salix viminalis TaxID=40686 RepID=A0A6N2N9T4_SALVM